MFYDQFSSTQGSGSSSWLPKGEYYVVHVSRLSSRCLDPPEHPVIPVSIVTRACVHAAAKAGSRTREPGHHERRIGHAEEESCHPDDP